MENLSSPNVFNSIQKRHVKLSSSFFWKQNDFLYAHFLFYFRGLILLLGTLSLVKNNFHCFKKSVGFLSPKSPIRLSFKFGDFTVFKHDAFGFQMLYNRRLSFINQRFTIIGHFDFKHHG